MTDIPRNPDFSAAPALIAGIALGATTAVGTALLLYTGQGFLKAAGLLVSSTVMALAAGLWAGAPEDRSELDTRGRWILLIVSLLLGGGFAALWSTREALRQVATGGALAVLLALALPAYAAGSVLAGEHARGRRARAGTDVAVVATAGAALGVLLATAVLIQRLNPWAVYYAAAALTSFAALRGWTSTPLRDAGENDMNGHVTLITGVGGAGQLGYDIAKQFAQAGAHVVVSARSAALEDVTAELARFGSVIGVRAELNVDADVAALIDAVQQRHGRLDSLINAAGGLTHIATVADTTPEQWRHEMERNAESALRMCRAALPLLRAANGAIVNFASPAGERAAANLAAYSAAKAAVIALTRALAIEEKTQRVRVNAIAPGIMDTDQNRAAMADTPADRFVARTDVAAAALFLASPAANGITGEVLHVVGWAVE